MSRIKNMTKCVCTVCKKKYLYRRGISYSRCGSCIVNQRRFKVKANCLDYKGNKCKRCGYNKCKDALNFHHIDPTKKSFSISGAHSRKWEEIRKELDKCILLCANCHAEEHAKLRKKKNKRN